MKALIALRLEINTEQPAVREPAIKKLEFVRRSNQRPTGLDIAQQNDEIGCPWFFLEVPLAASFPLERLPAGAFRRRQISMCTSNSWRN
jgi:hypothetical protein